MNPTTTRHATPAASRGGRWTAALPNDPGLDEILADPTLGSTAKALVVVMVRNWAWVKDHCWPCDRTLAAKVGKSVGQVQRCLQELEHAGRIRRERTDAVPNGRRIWLLWRRPGGREGAQREIASARRAPAAPARNERVVVVNEGMEPEIPSASRRRSEVNPDPTAIHDATPTLALSSGADESSELREPSPTPQESHETPPDSTATEELPTPTARAHPGLAGGLPDGPAPPADPDGPPALPMLLDLGVIGRSMTPPATRPGLPKGATPGSPATSTPSSMSPSVPRRRNLGMSLAELVGVVGETADPILAAELARRTAPPAPPELPPGSVPTAGLLAKLPGRHDLIAAATHRLAEALGDFKPASWSFFQRAVEAVATRSVSPEVLLDCHRQATGPKAKDPGKVFVTAWKREAHLRC